MFADLGSPGSGFDCPAGSTRGVTLGVVRVFPGPRPGRPGLKNYFFQVNLWVELNVEFLVSYCQKAFIYLGPGVISKNSISENNMMWFDEVPSCPDADYLDS